MTIPNQQAIEAAAQALYDLFSPKHGDFNYPEDSEIEAVLTAALPALEQAIREEIAKAIESDCDAEEPLCYGCWNAAQIARGEA